MRKHIKQIFSLLLLLLLLTAPNVYADGLDSNAEAGDGTGLGGTNRNVWSLPRQGYSMYVADLSGTPVQPIRNFWFEQPEGDNEYVSTLGGKGFTSSGNMPGDLSAIPRPLEGDKGLPNGDALREWVNDDSSLSGLTNGEWLVWRYLGGIDKLKLFQNKQCKLVIEAIFWYYPNNVQGTRSSSISGTIKNIAQWTIDNPDYSTDFNGNHSDYGDYWAYSFLGNNAPHSLQLGYYDTDYKIGMPANSGQTTMTEIIDRSQGYGMHIYKMKDFEESTKTYDEVQSSPAPAPKMEPEISDTSVRDILRPVEIIKVYETTDIDQFGNKTTTTDAVTYRKYNCQTIQIMDEPNVGEGYTVTNWRESTDRISPSIWKDVYGTTYIKGGTGSRTVTIYEGSKVLYVHLEHINQVETEETELILRESEITRAFDTTLVKDWGAKTMKFSWSSFSGKCTVQISAGGHSGCTDGTCSPGDPNCKCECTYTWGPDVDSNGNLVKHENTGTCNCTNQTAKNCDKDYTITDGSYNLLIKAETSDDNVIPVIDPFKTLESFGMYHSGTVSSTDAGSVEISDYAAKFVLWRGDDIPTLASFEDTSSQEVNALVPVGDTPQDERKEEDYDKPITVSLKADPDDNPDSDFDLAAACPDHTDQCKSVTIAAENDIEYSGTAKTQVYSGEEKSLAEEMPNAEKLKNTSRNGGYVVSSYATWLNTEDEALTFYPVIRMSYQKPGAQKEEKTEVFILSQHLSELKIASAVKVEWQSNNTGKPYNVEVKSDQWASDINATNGSAGWKKPGYVLDGGYIYQLSTSGDGSGLGSTITLTGYYPSIGGSESAKIQSMDSSWTGNNGYDEFSQLVNNAVNKINNGTMDQYLDTYSATGTQTALGGVKVYPGAALGRQYGGSSQCQTDSKYYLRDTSGSNSNHVSGSSSGVKSTPYQFWSDYKGNIYMNGGIILYQGDGIEKLKGEAKTIDDYTKVVTNLVGAITRNKGNDEQADWVDNGHWYNEQSPVITINRYTATIKVNIKDRDGQGGVQSVLDPNLCPKSAGTRDKYSAANITQFVINFDNDIGTVFNGQRVGIPNSDYLLVSRYFYIPNVNAQQKD